MRLANQGGPVAIGSKLSDKRVGAGGEGSIVEDDTMRGGHPAGHDRRAVGHTDRVRHEGPVEYRAAVGQAIEVGCRHDRVPGKSNMISALLVSDEEQDVRLGHTAFR
jgi:hypothetical protein